MNRRGNSKYVGSVYDYQVGDIVNSVVVSDFHFTGEVVEVDPKCNKVIVSWGGVSKSAHNPDELMPFQPSSRKASISKFDVFKSADQMADGVLTNLLSNVSEYIDEEVGSVVDNKEAYELVFTTALNKVIRRLQSRGMGFARAASKTGVVEFVRPGGSVFLTARDGKTALDMWKRRLYDFKVDGEFFEKNDFRGREAIERLFGIKYRVTKNEPTEEIYSASRYDDDEDEYVVCPHCDTEWMESECHLGGLGNMKHYRCRNCGGMWNKTRRASLKSRRAMYWCAPERTYRLTRIEQDSGSAVCPKCKSNMSKETFTKSDKLLSCPSCGFKIPTSKAVTEIGLNVPNNVKVKITKTDEDGIDHNMTASRRGILADVDPSELTRLPQMSLSEIAALIYKDWHNVYFGAKPYLQAMSSMRSIDEDYGMDSGRSVVAYALSNMSTWRGDVAKAVKKELQRRLRK